MNELPLFRDWHSSRLCFLLTEYVMLLDNRVKPLRGAERRLYQVWADGMQAELDRRSAAWGNRSNKS